MSHQETADSVVFGRGDELVGFVCGILGSEYVISYIWIKKLEGLI